MGETTSCVDRISELPDFILHQILSLLPTKAAAKTCVVSKRWHHIWETFPVLDCCQLFFGKYLDIINPKELGLPKDVRRNIFAQRLQFMSYVDEKLRCIFENDRCVKKFRLVMTLVSVGLFPRVDSWIDMVSVLSVRELELRLTLGRARFYHFPVRVIGLQSLTILSLKGCMFGDGLCRDDLKHSSLVELHLHGCLIDAETIVNLVSFSRSLEVLSLKACLGFTKLELHGHEKLRKLVYNPYMNLNIKKFSINLPNLEELEFGFSHVKTGRPAFISDWVSPNLKRLSLCSIFIDVKALRDIVSSFPLLEYLFLGGCVVKEAVKLSSSILKELYLRNCTYTERVEIYTPALQVFKYCSMNMSQLSLKCVAGNRIAQLFVPLRNMDRSWFKELNNFLRKNRFQELILNTTVGRGYEVPFSTENFVREQLPDPVELKSMKLVMHAFSSFKYAALLDGLFWDLHPKTLRLELNYNSPTYVKELLKNLVVGEEPECCRAVYPENLKCWRHSLKGIKVVNVKGFQAGTPLDLCTLNMVNNFLDSWANEAQKIVDSYEVVKGETLSFDLSW